MLSFLNSPAGHEAFQEGGRSRGQQQGFQERRGQGCVTPSTELPALKTPTAYLQPPPTCGQGGSPCKGQKRGFSHVWNVPKARARGD